MKLPSHFYAMVDPLADHEPVELARMMLEAGARVMQLRLKDACGRDFLKAAREIAALCQRSGAMLLVNDRIDIAMLAGAAGIHLGQTDIPLRAARKLMGQDRIIGISTASVEQARAAQAGGADYIGFGPMYPGGAKQIVTGQGLAILREVRAAVGIPIVAIGGITEPTVPDLLAAGADAVAIISDVVYAPDIPTKIKRLLALSAVA
ncbi:MAG TPA: thiamine phosphate synthase [Candidatus Binataceae bacterium]|nr:thiamine phosphate synthase [Candidatus Binataceae bacterium]